MKVLNESGQGLTEYVILLLLVAVTSVVTVRSLGKTIQTKLHEAQTQINHVKVGRGSSDGGDTPAGPTPESAAPNLGGWITDLLK